MKIREDILLYAKLAQRRLGMVAGQVEVTSHCYQRCRACSSWREDRDKSQSGEFTLDQMRNLAMKLRLIRTFEHLTLTGGDPQAWPWLEDFLAWFIQLEHDLGVRFRLQVSTALMEAVEEPKLWRKAFSDVRVSFDALDAGVYTACRGVVVDPLEILERLARLDHPSVATLTTVHSDNIGQVEPILFELKRRTESGLKLRKAIFLLALGTLAGEWSQPFLQKWERLGEVARSMPFQTNFCEDPRLVLRAMENPEMERLPCRVGNISFHIKANGDVYPCCLVGGEAIETCPEFALGNLHGEDLVEIMGRYEVKQHYLNLNAPCRKVCQFKQFQVNLAGEMAAKTRLAMP
jgi:radical SAM protein with 4Fe4S-binding SPASM domain